MYIKEINEQLKTSVSEAFENILFGDVNEIEEDSQKIEDPIEVRLMVNHPVAGEFSLIVPRLYALEAASTVYSFEYEEIKDELITDLFSELLNTIAGSTMRAILPKDQTFSLGIPEKDATLATDFEEDNTEVKFSYFTIDDEYVIKIGFYTH